MKQYKLSIPDAINSQITAAHEQSNFYALLPSQFIKHLITMGLKEYQAQCELEQARTGIRLLAAGCETAPDMMPEQRTDGKIIPFPGVVLKDDFQNSIDCFLREIGYIE